MKQTICNIVYETIKKDQPDIDTSWKDLGFKGFDDMLHQIKTDVHIALWALMNLEYYSDWEHEFIVGTMNDEYETPVYQVGNYAFKIEYYDDYEIIPLKQVTKTVVVTSWEEI